MLSVIASSMLATIASAYNFDWITLDAGGWVTGMSVHPKSKTVYARTDGEQRVSEYCSSQAFNFEDTTFLYTTELLERSGWGIHVERRRSLVGLDFWVYSRH